MSDYETVLCDIVVEFNHEERQCTIQQCCHVLEEFLIAAHENPKLWEQLKLAATLITY